VNAAAVRAAAQCPENGQIKAELLSQAVQYEGIAKAAEKRAERKT